MISTSIDGKVPPDNEANESLILLHTFSLTSTNNSLHTILRLQCLYILYCFVFVFIIIFLYFIVLKVVSRK